MALAVVAVGLIFPTSASADQRCQLRPDPVASVLVIHAGAWQGGSGAAAFDLCLELSLLGYRVQTLDYPLGTIPGSIEYVQAAAARETRSGLPVYALGTSAGGTIAEYLAARGDVDGALAIAPISNLETWELRPGFWKKLGMTPSLRRRWSPYYNIDRPSSLRIVHSRQDEVVPYGQSVQMVKKCGAACQLVLLNGGPHSEVLVWQAIPALQWFSLRAGRPLRRLPRAGEPAQHHVRERSRRWLRVASRAFPRHCRPIRLVYRPLPRPRWERTSRRRCTVTLARRLHRKPAWVRCTAVVHAVGHLTARWSRRHARDRRSVMHARIVKPYRGRRARCPGR